MSDFLAEMYKHIMELINARWTEGFVASTPILFVLTVPAMWSDVAKQATLTAAKQAGIHHDIRLISGTFVCV